jgi:hypothetical protein
VKLSFCINCGNEKPDPHEKCNSCNFEPIEESDVVKSVWLSTDRRLSESDLEFDVKPDFDELQEFARKISEGDSPDYPEDDLIILREQYSSVNEISGIKAILFGCCFLILPVSALILFFIK